MAVAIITDSTSDLSNERAEDLGVTRVSLYVNLDGTTYKDWVEIEPAVMIEKVRQGADIPTTSQPSPQDFIDAYNQAKANGADEIVCLTLSGKLSQTVQAANIASQDVDIPVHVFDTKLASGSIIMMLEKAAEWSKEGKTAHEILAGLEDMQARSKIFFSVGSLDFLQKNGRIGGAQALLGGLLNIKPILTLDDGTIQPLGKARGEKRARKEIVAQVKKFAAEHTGKLHLLFLGVEENGAFDQAKLDILRNAIQDEDIEFVDHGASTLGSVISAHVGPGTYAVCCYADDSSD